ncbi:MAG: HNH endonuclease [Bacteroidales bacterium]|jgi:5-methylcytosine-specific restriction endonuclease McrA|nr:HNH endonuclease [Bacteroidales bacterium]
MSNETEQETTDLVHGSYKDLLFDVRWKRKRARILDRDGYKCVVCGSTENLTVHHKQYHVDKDGRKHVPWDYDDKYLVTLCNVCHRRGHAMYNVPVFEV